MDAGEALVEHLFREMRIDEEWAVRRPRGFTWWAGALAQHVWAEPPVEDYGANVSRVHVQTDVLSGFRADPNSINRLGATTGFATMSGPLVAEGGVRSAASVFVHEDALKMWKHLLTIAALIQVADAHVTVETLAGLVDASPAVSAHPTSGFRETNDDTLNVIRDAFAPLGRRPSMFIGRDFSDAEKAIGWQVSELTTADDTGLTSEFPFGEGTGLFQMITETPHPQLGNGLMLLLTLPTKYPPDRLPSLALEMNGRELSEFTRTPFLGSWCPHASLPNTLSFVTFLPNVCALPGLPTPFLQYAAGRAKWVLESVAGGSLEESRKKSMPAAFNFLRRR